MQVVACQFDIAWEDKETSHARARSLLSAAAIEPGALVLLPEMCATGFSMDVAKIAEPQGGPTHAFLAGLAKDLKAYVMGGLVTRGREGRGRNEAVVFAPDGNELARYCKMQPFSYAGETKHYESGEGIVLFEWQGLQVAPLVCYDLRFPELFRAAVRRGAELMTVVANWPLARQEHWLALLRARAIENQCYVVGANRVGSDPHVPYGGHSLVVSPRGETLSEGGEAAGLVIGDVDRNSLLEYRRQFPALRDMRSEFFCP